MTTKASAYYPTKIKFKVLKNRIYKLSWMQHEREHIKLLTKSGCLAMANDPNVNKDVRAELMDAFERGDVE